jgi:hypothetical protein
MSCTHPLRPHAPNAEPAPEFGSVGNNYV